MNRKIAVTGLAAHLGVLATNERIVICQGGRGSGRTYSIIRILEEQYNAMAADVRNGEAGIALAKQIQALRTPKAKKVAVVDDSQVGNYKPQTAKEFKRELGERIASGKVGANRNSPCPCGSGLKFKKCCFFLDKPIHITP